MTARTAPPPRLHADADAPQGASLAALTSARLLHQRVLLLDRELEQVGGAALAAQLLLLAA